MSFIKLGNAGDTIVEVLISLAVLSLAFVLSYSTASRALIDSQNSQEHSQALEYLDSQVEALFYMSNQGATFPSGQFCLAQTGSGFTFETGNSPTTPLTYQPKLYQSACQIIGTGGFDYLLNIAPLTSSPSTPSQANTYVFSVVWPGLSNLGTQTEELSYTVYDQ